MTKDSGDDGMPELDDISKIGKKVRTRPSQKTIKTQDHLTRPSHKAITQDHLTRPSHKTISQGVLTRPLHKTISQGHHTRPSHKTITKDHLTRLSHMAISQDHQDSRQDHLRCWLHCILDTLHFTSRAEQTNKQKEIEKLDLGTATFQILDTLAHSLYWPSRSGQVAQWFTFRI